MNRSPQKAHLRLVTPGDPAAAERPEDAPPADPKAAVEDAFRRYAPLVASLGLRITALRDEIDDFVQEVFLRATRGIGALRHQGATKAWLVSITINVARQRLRVRKLRKMVGLASSPDEQEDIVDPALSPEDRLLLTRMYRALDALPVNQRLAWSLRHIEGERLETVALLCGCSLATAKRRIVAAQKAISEAVV
ncbi:MAG TPA: RNA polymerase sigma factor [Polyangia bacterium]|nr:RNA polymerase sigma factor [Polyangia bacterium]